MCAHRMQVHVLDDDAVLGKALVWQLRSLQCDGQAFTAVDALLEHPATPDLLIVDFNLCGTTALHCAASLEQRCPSVPRVLLTASVLTAEEEANARAAGYREIVRKPWHLADLRELVARYQPASGG